MGASSERLRQTRTIEDARAISNRKYDYFEALQELQKEKGSTVPDLSIVRELLERQDDKE